MISPFNFPDQYELPFGENTVASLLRDAIVEIRSASEAHIGRKSIQRFTIDPPEFRNPVLLDFARLETPSTVQVEVQGWSLESLISFARKVIGTETFISGDLILTPNGFLLIARTYRGGPWQTSSVTPSGKGLKKACMELAENMLCDLDPPMAASYALVTGAPQVAHKRLMDALKRPNAHVTCKRLAIVVSATVFAELFDEHDPDAALSLLRVALVSCPNEALLEYAGGVSWEYSSHPNCYAKAISHYEAALRIRPSFPEALFALGRIHSQSSRYNIAYEKFQRAVELEPQPLFPYLSAAARTLGDLGANKKARDWYDRAIAEARDFWEQPELDQETKLAFRSSITSILISAGRALLNEARLQTIANPLSREKYLQDAEKHLIKAHNLTPNDTAAIYLLAKIHAEQEHYDEALKWFETLNDLQFDKKEELQEQIKRTQILKRTMQDANR